MGLQGKTVLVTGGSGGIGRELVRAFGAEGARVAFTYHRDDDTARRLEQDGNGRVRALRHRLDEEGGAGRILRAVTEWAGPVDVLVNNALFQPENPELQVCDLAASPWRDMLRWNIEPAVEFSSAALRQMRKTGWGRIIQVSSSLVSQGKAGFEFYGAAKSALHGFNRSLAFSAGRSGDILCNVVVLGLTRTENNEVKPWFPEYRAEFLAGSPLGRLADAAQVSKMVVVLGSAANQVMTGQEIHLSSGTVGK
ncbi:SDR family NAD(P)-dependent oxidoreductase [Streptomyces sp. NPDC058773]|uniref:SDR family NAD(P)-dependent oxidoreductase n=1 Tax=Streptomyces sp. NPDC058773 TaxID=3346632 RepID=UPI0036CDD672